MWEEGRQRDADGLVFSAGQKLMTAKDAKNIRAARTMRLS